MYEEAISWLLETGNPSVRYFTLRHLQGLSETSPVVKEARQAIMQWPPVRDILGSQTSEGWWEKTGAGYSPKYTGTTWQLLWLAELGADGSHEGIRKGCSYFLDHATVRRTGALSPNNQAAYAVDCFNGNMLFALERLGWVGDPRVQQAIDALCQRMEEKGFSCMANGYLPCAWGAIKTLKGFAEVPADQRTPRFPNAIAQGTKFLLDRELAKATYPTATTVSSDWSHFSFPLSYTSDILEALEVLAAHGHAGHPRLATAVDLVVAKQDAQHLWKREHAYRNPMGFPCEPKGMPSKWVTLRALRVLKAFGRLD